MNKEKRKEIKDAVIETLQSYGEQLSLPVPIKAIAKSFPEIRVIPYSRQMKSRNLTYGEMIIFAGTEDAFTDYYSDIGLFIIYYNDVDQKKMSSKRYRWNIAHELGHIVLKHHQRYTGSRIFRNSIGKELYKNLEQEADQFAAYILVPHIIVDFVGKYADESVLKIACDISGVAAGIRLREIRNWHRRGVVEEYDFRLLDIFSEYVEDNYCSLSVQKWLETKRSCIKCHSHIPHKLALFCPACGEKCKPHYEMERKMMVFPGIEMSENYRAVICPTCGNSEIAGNENFCMICGERVVNLCSRYAEEVDFIPNDNCHNLLRGNARYCPYCGAESTFFKRRILNGWDGNAYEEGVLPF